MPAKLESLQSIGVEPDPTNEAVIAYFSMEIALAPGMNTYSGGLGVLAGDMLRSAADGGYPLVGVTLIHRRGYFVQHLDADGRQGEIEALWDLKKFLAKTPHRATIAIEGRQVHLCAWRYTLRGTSGHSVPIYLLDSDLPENSEEDRRLTDVLYGGDERYRLCQEAILGIGGVRMLRAIGYDQVRRFHMNEGHSSLLALELLDESAAAGGRRLFDDSDIEAVRAQTVFTTHTPVSSGHDQFPLDLVKRVLGRNKIFENHEIFCCEGALNMTYLALNLSHYVNGVARKHGEVAQHTLTPRRKDLHYDIDWITNGVHAASWVSPPFQKLFDHHIPGWREDNFSLRNALSIPRHAIWRAHLEAKELLIEHVNDHTNDELDIDTLTIGIARRAATYKRLDLVFHDLERLRRLSSSGRPIQLVLAGKAHPRDEAGKDVIRRVFQAIEKLRSDITVTYLDDYDIQLARLLTAGSDVWLNTPLPPLEASGTSGMKAALNGVPSLSILDGWWLEGCIEGVTGWSIGRKEDGPADDHNDRDATSLYAKLESKVIPLFYDDWSRFAEIMQHCIALNGSFFNAQRMAQQYVCKAYLL